MTRKRKLLKHYYYSYNEFIQDVNELTKTLQNHSIDAIVAIARGGVTFGHFLAIKLNLRALFTINSIHYEKEQKLETIEIFNIPNLTNYKNILIVDDIIDSGDTMQEVVKRVQKEFQTQNILTATLFYKESAPFKPNFYCKIANAWIDFFWEVD